MFVGHYGVAFAASAWRKTLPLWVAFLAVQLVDIVWAIFVMAGVEKLRIVPGFTATNPLDLYYQPYTHSLLGSLAWAIAAGVAFRWWFGKEGMQAGVVVVLAVFSHWILDLVVHKPDLPLWDNSHKVGFALWNWPIVAVTLELALLFGGLSLYLRATSASNAVGRLGPLALCALMAVIHCAVFFVQPPPSEVLVGAEALLLFVVFALASGRLERHRVPSTRSKSAEA